MNELVYRLQVKNISKAKVVVSARSESKLKSLVEEIQSFGGVATFLVADVEVFEQVKAIADKTIEVYGRLDSRFIITARRFQFTA